MTAFLGNLGPYFEPEIIRRMGFRHCTSSATDPEERVIALKFLLHFHRRSAVADKSPGAQLA
jgi:hypothetical protein